MPSVAADSAVSLLLQAFPAAIPNQAAVLDRDGGMAFASTRVPGRSGGVATIKSAVAPEVVLEVLPLDVKDAPSRSVRGVLSFGEVAPGTELAWSARADRIEELRYVRAVGAEYRARYRLRVQGGAHAVVHGGVRVDIVDAASRVVIEGVPMEAVDAQGNHRALTASLTDQVDGSVVLTVALDTHDLVAPLAIDPAWVTATSMITTRNDGRSATLLDGRILVMGGENVGSKFTTNAEAYQPSTNTWVSAGSGGAGINQAVAMTSSGRVVRAGGFSGLAPRKDAAVFDPTSSSWTTVTPAFLWYVNDAAAAPTGANEVIVCGGTSTNGATGAECSFINTSAATMTAAASMPAFREGFAMTNLADGTVLAAGGSGTGGALLTSAWRYNRTTNTWATAATAKATHTRPTLTRLASGRVLMLGGGSVGELFDPTANTWSNTGAMTASRTGHTATLLANGKVLVVGGGTSSSQLYDPATNTFGPAGTMLTSRTNHTAGRLPDGRVLVSGDVTITNSSEIWGRLLTQTCAFNYECVNGQCVDGVCCGSASCPSGSSCNLAGKVGTCSKPLGVACGGAGECASGNCVDGVCCNNACTGQCSSCNVSGKAGTCSPVLGAPVGARAACGGTGAGTTCGRSCDGSSLGACTFPTATTSCGADACTSGLETRVGSCNGAGACAQTTKSCGIYSCSGTSCLTTCSTGSDCVAGYYCKGSACAPAEGLGKVCATASDCSTGFCTDGVCCGVASCGLGSSCAVAGSEGTCKKKLSTKCSIGAECGSGNCVDGVCCETACDGQCEACDVEGKVGRCMPVNGAPHGARTACDDGAGAACAAKSCKATDPTKCVGFVADNAVTCAPAKCDGTDWIASSRCDGAGTCAPPKPSSCLPYVCTDIGCRKTCETDEHCAKGFACIGSRCEARGATCSDDRLSTVSPDATSTSCVPYRCLDSGDCGKTCKYSSECAPGFVCDGTTCVAQPTGGEEDTGGCGFGHGNASAVPFALFGLLGLGLVSRRRSVR